MIVFTSAEEDLRAISSEHWMGSFVPNGRANISIGSTLAIAYSKGTVVCFRGEYAVVGARNKENQAFSGREQVVAAQILQGEKLRVHVCWIQVSIFESFRKRDGRCKSSHVTWF